MGFQELVVLNSLEIKEYGFYSRLGPVRENTEWKCLVGCCYVKVLLISFFPFYLCLQAESIISRLAPS